MPFLHELVDFAIFSLDRPLPVCDAYSGLAIEGVPLKFSFLKLPVLDVKSEKWKAPDANESRLNDCIFLGYGDTDQDVADGQLRIQENVSVYSANNRLFIPLNFTTKLGRACRGDSGGPLICHDKNGEQRLYGIMSNSETPMPGSKKNCFTDKDTFAFDILTDIRYILPQLRSSLIKMGKLDELIEDYERCGDHRPDQQTNKLNKILGSGVVKLLAECCNASGEKPQVCQKLEVNTNTAEDQWVKFVVKLENAISRRFCEKLFSYSEQILNE
ncbi:hypothetical protein Tcan_12190 [Toxocara canis]|uniref:Peptidase S1 domain-containing protein n=1 Tax=Toxocara canis TaxID=6265 RepID=A0A0B2USG9_TOXCA|nr:hypothetical protein Tcan_12190 [Toxocara canis]